MKSMKKNSIVALITVMMIFVIIVSPSLAVFASDDSDYFSDKHTLYSIYQPIAEDEVSPAPLNTPINMTNIKSFYSSQGGDSTKLNIQGNSWRDYVWSNGSYDLSNYGAQFQDIFAQESISFDYQNGTNVLDGSPATTHVILLINTNNSSAIARTGYKKIILVKPQSDNGHFALVDNRVVSEVPFDYFCYFTADSLSYLMNPSATAVGHVATADESTGYYSVDINGYSDDAIYTMAFTDMDINLSTSDGSSGFTAYGTDYDMNAENFNFNFPKVGNITVSPSDPQPPVVDEEDVTGQHYNYCGISHKYEFRDTNSGWISTIRVQPNNFMYLHPEQYTLIYEIEGLVRFSGNMNVGYAQALDGTYSYSTSIPLSEVIDSDTSYSRAVPLSIITNNADSSLNLGTAMTVLYNGAQGISGNSSVVGLDDIWFSTEEGGTITTPFSPYLDEFYVTTTITIQWNGQSNSVQGGTYIDKHNFMDGSTTTLTNTSATNYNPSEGGSDVNGYYGNINVGGGGNTTNTNSPSFNNSDNITIVQDSSKLYVSTDAIQGFADIMEYIKNTVVANGNSNGFTPVVATTYSFVPSYIWAVILLGVSTTVAVCVIRNVIRH